jgi:hypothetical protein
MQTPTDSISEAQQLRQLGFRVYILDDADQIPEIIGEMGGETDGA